MTTENTQLDHLSLASYRRELIAILRPSNRPIWALVGILGVVLLGSSIAFVAKPVVNVLIWFLAISVFACYLHQYLLIDKKPRLSQLLGLPVLSYFFMTILVSLVVVAITFVFSLPIIFMFGLGLGELASLIDYINVSLPVIPATFITLLVVVFVIALLLLCILAIIFGQFHAWYFSMLQPNTAIGNPMSRPFERRRAIGYRNYLIAVFASFLVWLPYVVVAIAWLFIPNPYVVIGLLVVVDIMRVVLIVVTQNIMFKYWIIGIDSYSVARRKTHAELTT